MEKRVSKSSFSMTIVCSLVIFSVSTISSAQGGKEFIEWLKQYSPTGYFVINDYETQAKDPGFHKAYIMNKNAPIPVVPVHEVCHMWNWKHGGSGTGNANGFFIGDNKGYKVPKSFKAFNSKEIAGEIPSELKTTITDIYIIKGVNGQETGSMVNGIYGIMDEYSTYVTGLKAGVEMGACLKANFDKSEHWKSLASEASSAVEGSPEFRYFILKYIMYAKKKHADIYDKIIADKELKEVYTILRRYHEKTMTEYVALLKTQNMDTEKGNGFDWYKKFSAELEKQEYKDLEKLLLVDISNINYQKQKMAIVTGSGLFFDAPVSVDVYSLLGRRLQTLSLDRFDDHAFTTLRSGMERKFGCTHYIVTIQGANRSAVWKTGDGVID